MSNIIHTPNEPDLTPASDDLPADVEATSPASEGDLFPSDAELTSTPARTAKKSTRTSKAPAKVAARKTKQISVRKQLAAKTPTPKTTKRTGTPRGQGYVSHEWERKSEDKPCLACTSPYVHSKGFCSPCYNAARRPLKQGLKGQALVNAVKERRSFPVTAADKARASREKKGATTAAKKEAATA